MTDLRYQTVAIGMDTAIGDLRFTSMSPEDRDALARGDEQYWRSRHGLTDVRLGMTVVLPELDLVPDALPNLVWRRSGNVGGGFTVEVIDNVDELDQLIEPGLIAAAAKIKILAALANGTTEDLAA
ncbi:hypothetical protein [Nocardia sp. NPDC051570]|uniref:hypothetical protein n=1 Tax=Nocardia sp. NPDC051570 TaxID=3364324 RepID=UPI0037B7647D